MEITVRVDDNEGPFLIELLRKFSFVREVNANSSTLAADRISRLWQEKGQKLFATDIDLIGWLNVPNRAVNQAKPMELLQSEEGYQTVSTLLGRMEHGVMA